MGRSGAHPHVFRWPRPDEALVTFATPALARQAVSARTNRSTVLVVELLSQTREEKRMGYRRGTSMCSSSRARMLGGGRARGRTRLTKRGRKSKGRFHVQVSHVYV